MFTRKYNLEQVMNLRPQIEVEVDDGKATSQACWDAGFYIQT